MNLFDMILDELPSILICVHIVLRRSVGKFSLGRFSFAVCTSFLARLLDVSFTICGAFLIAVM